MKFRHRSTVLIIAVVTMLGFSTTPVLAYTIWECADDSVCLFDSRITPKPDYYRYVINDQAAGFCFNIPADWDNRTNQVYNRSDHSITLYTGNVCNGALEPYPILPGQNKGMGDNEEEANSVLFMGGSGCLSEAPCLGNSHNLRS